MNYQDQLKLQAFLDGELPEADTAETANWLARDRDAVALLAELRHTRQAMAGFEKGVLLPESREFYWSKIQREIERQQTPAREPARTPFYARLHRFLMPAASLALLVIMGLVGARYLPGGSPLSGFETAFDDAGAFTYRDFSTGATLVWLSYPADNDLDEEDDFGTLD